ncbi:YjbH domain-containing protein [Vibrio alginolyticus]|uniref:YjbH domain-containing protein n=1 Tax=Vibrio TaxID=662 RepID=UPI0006D14E94|nr:MULTISPECIES: YjbH domain-containing protein [Vibrio]EIL8371387.1 YjbH domain-containing protein [Vibrio alginolyticus]EJN8559619.1 YjbH domain-containing protein [Vibrio alginolyticus]ELA7570033.1 YjbH domain-containing protein [Vibrio alginolyticus]ELB2925709.1 YjbH domain-containing protein [Vibrio alginolyticus]MBT0057578.1 YjbH domain-containing protein [Vibrio alginolyticus]
MAQKTIKTGIAALSLPLLVSTSLTAQELATLPSNQSFTGLTFTPNAQSLNYGDFSFTYAQGLPFRTAVQDLDSLKFSFGMFDGLEAHGRIVTDDYTSNCFYDCGDTRDLSMSFKYQVPHFWGSENLDFALGIQDLGGSANQFSTKYAVADYSFDFAPVRISAGYGLSDIGLGVMDGPFGGIEYQPLSFLQVSGEYDAVEFNSSVKLFTPQGTLPYDVTASLSYQLYSGHNTDEQNIWNAALSVPLVTGYTRSRDYSRNNLTLMEKLSLEQNKAKEASISALVSALRNEGFVNIQIGLLNQTTVVALENRRYNHNQVDGLGVAMGIISSHLGQNAVSEVGGDSERIELFMLANQKPVVSVQANSTCYQSFINGSAACEDIKFTTRDLAEKLELVNWKTERVNSGALDSQLVFSPMVRHAVATEFGVYDYSFAMSSNLYTYLWSGAAVDVRHILPLAETDDYEKWGYFEDSAYENDIERAMLHQFFRLPYVDIANQVSVGLAKTDYIGARSESTWFSQSGAHALSLEMSYFQHVDEKDENGYETLDRQTSLARYTFSMPEWDWQFNATAGEFWRGDVGAKLTTSHWFEDIEVSATYQVTKYKDTDEEQFVAVSVKLPLTPWRDMSPGLLQVRGNEAYDFNVMTRVGNDVNFLSDGQGDELIMDNSMLRRYFNRGRYGSDYFEENKIRLRNAYLRYLSTQLD